MAKNMSKESAEKIDAIVSEVTNKTKEFVADPDKVQSPLESVVPEIKDEEKPVREEIPKKEISVPYTDAEREASLRGWRRLEEYEGDPSKWRSAEEFLEVGKIYDQNKSVKLERELSVMQKQLAKVLELNQRQAEKLSQEKADYLEAARVQAIQEGNVEQVNRIDTQLHEVKKEKASVEVHPAEKDPYLQQKAESFRDRNKDWFNSDSIENMELVRLAVEYEKNLGNSRPDLDAEQRLDMTERAIRSSSLYRSAHSNPNRDKPTAVNLPSSEDSTKKSSGTKGKSFKDLPRETQDYVNNLYKRVPNLKVSRDDYAKQLFEMGAINE